MRVPWIAVVSPSKTVPTMELLQSLLPERIVKRRPHRGATYTNRLHKRVTFKHYDDSDSDSGDEYEEHASPLQRNPTGREWYWIQSTHDKNGPILVVPSTPPERHRKVMDATERFTGLLDCFSGVVVFSNRPDTVTRDIGTDPRILVVPITKRMGFVGGAAPWRGALQEFAASVLPTEKEVLNATRGRLPVGHSSAWSSTIPSVYFGTVKLSGS